jgi:hypothetical protein
MGSVVEDFQSVLQDQNYYYNDHRRNPRRMCIHIRFDIDGDTLAISPDADSKRKTQRAKRFLEAYKRVLKQEV